MLNIKFDRQNLDKYAPFLYVLLGVFVFILIINHKPKVDPKHDQSTFKKSKSDIGLNVSGIDQKAYLTRLEKSYFDSLDKIKSLENQMNKIEQMLKTVEKKDKQKRRKKEIDLSEVLLKDTTTMPLKQLELAVAEVASINKENNPNDVYLPLGSFCKGTLMTGVYAAADQQNPLPVLIRLDEAFFGPNNSRIPLKGSFALGKAYGDLVSERALIQIIAISSVFSDGTTFEHEQNLGYITDQFGELGIQGEVIRNTGRQLAMSFMTGFMSGGSQALADQETSIRETENGSVVKQVSGSMAKNAIFSGLAKSAGKMSDHYGKQAEDLVPAIHIRNGQEVYFIVQKGVRINGLSRSDDIAFNSKY